ncbi:hypothetical protein M0811_08568 [Anaeramoeba ignava]|uniref:Fibronectin type-III domain-containing protein n=1 Tax=Anaeramoeba ignava TaxID=1746090 RepID=A0A9Q0RAU3_ANAIG|nr:hypothetical protein M0811_08568 [Anaeramoeba ignava]
MKSNIFFFFLIINIFLIQSIQTQPKSISSLISTIQAEIGTTRYYSTPDEGWFWSLINNYSGSGYFGNSVSVYEDVLVIGAEGVAQVFVYRYNGTNFELEQNIYQPGTHFGWSVSVYKDALVIGNRLDAYKVDVYRYNGTYWNEEQMISQVAGQFGYFVSIYENVTVVGTYADTRVFVYRYNGTFWNQEQIITKSVTNFGSSVSVYDDVIAVGTYQTSQAFVYRYNGTFWNEEQSFSVALSWFGHSVSVYGNALAIGAAGPKQAYIYRYNETYWNQEQIINGPGSSSFGWSLSVYNDSLVVGAIDTKQGFIYRYNGTFWNEVQVFTQSSVTDFGYSVSIYKNFTAIGSQHGEQGFIYQHYLIPQVNILNCSSFFSSFDCYWDETEIPPTLKYQINYGYDWIDIDSPILEDGNVYYQQFNSSIYDNITGNEYYSIQIRACYNETMSCGEPSSSINLTTRIDSVKDFQLSNPSDYSINANWDYPNVQVDEGVAHLDHYNLSYFNQSDPDSISFFSVDNSSLSYLLENINCGYDYNISIWGCRTLECEGDDKGEVCESSISILFAQVPNLSCSISNLLDIDCSWDQPINCSIPDYYNFTYQAISQDDSGNYQSNSTNQHFKAQFPNQEYQINVSACPSNGNCGDITTTSITTGNLIAPTIYETIPKIEEIEFNFTKVSNANNYSISLDNGTNWQNFTSLDLSGNEVIGTLSEIAGNVQYNISIRGCVDSDCEPQYFGLPSSITSTRVILGNITSLNCSALPFGFECNWDALVLSSGLQAYSFNYNSTTICLTNLTTSVSISLLLPEEYYEISVYSSADENCLGSEYSGINSTTSITTSNLEVPTIYETIPKIEEIELNFTKVSNANNYSISLDNGTNWQNFTSLDLSGNEIQIVNLNISDCQVQ